MTYNLLFISFGSELFFVMLMKVCHAHQGCVVTVKMYSQFFVTVTDIFIGNIDTAFVCLVESTFEEAKAEIVWNVFDEVL